MFLFLRWHRLNTVPTVAVCLFLSYQYSVWFSNTFQFGFFQTKFYAFFILSCIGTVTVTPHTIDFFLFMISSLFFVPLRHQFKTSSLCFVVIDRKEMKSNDVNCSTVLFAAAICIFTARVIFHVSNTSPCIVSFLDIFNNSSHCLGRDNQAIVVLLLQMFRNDLLVVAFQLSLTSKTQHDATSNNDLCRMKIAFFAISKPNALFYFLIVYILCVEIFFSLHSRFAQNISVTHTTKLWNVYTNWLSVNSCNSLTEQHLIFCANCLLCATLSACISATLWIIMSTSASVGKMQIFWTARVHFLPFGIWITTEREFSSIFDGSNSIIFPICHWAGGKLSSFTSTNWPILVSTWTFVHFFLGNSDVT